MGKYGILYGQIGAFSIMQNKWNNVGFIKFCHQQN
jgi:hypothetical protein